MKNSYLTAGITLGRLIRLLKRNKVDLNARTIYRLAFLFQSACWSSLFSIVEKAWYGRKLQHAPIPDDPLFIIGHWRTGSTFLHQLLSLDPGLHAPTLFEVAVPDSFLVSYPYYRPIFKRLIPEHRPMDMVKIGMDEPQEDEYAIYRTTTWSPLESLVFQKSGHYFLNTSTRFLPLPDYAEAWNKNIQNFFTKIHYQHKLRIVSKNPFHSFRINELLKLFPRAKFIHIVRHPYDVVPSSIHMWKILGEQNSLTSSVGNPSVEEVTIILDQLLKAVDKAKTELPPETLVEIRFEDLEQDPLNTLELLYRELECPFTEIFRQKIEGFLKNVSNYKKNGYIITEQDKQVIRERLKNHMEQNNYR